MATISFRFKKNFEIMEAIFCLLEIIAGTGILLLSLDIIEHITAKNKKNLNYEQYIKR